MGTHVPGIIRGSARVNRRTVIFGGAIIGSSSDVSESLPVSNSWVGVAFRDESRTSIIVGERPPRLAGGDIAGGRVEVKPLSTKYNSMSIQRKAVPI
jgi:hypothetical protein